MRQIIFLLFGRFFPNVVTNMLDKCPWPQVDQLSSPLVELACGQPAPGTSESW